MTVSFINWPGKVNTAATPLEGAPSIVPMIFQSSMNSGFRVTASCRYIGRRGSQGDTLGVER